MEKKLEILPQRKKGESNVSMAPTKAIQKPEYGSRIRSLKQKGKGKKNRSQLKF